MEDKKLLLIIPCYNEDARISEIETAFDLIFTAYSAYDFLLVNDGSTDNTIGRLQSIEQKHDNVKVLDLKQNSGKAEAIRQGVLSSLALDYFYIGYMDADLATPIEELHKMKLFADENANYNFLMGSRIKRLGSNIIRYPHRHYFGRVFATIVSLFILKDAVYDTQCGAKIIKAPIAAQIFSEPFVTKWLFDVELLLRFKITDKAYAQKVYEFCLTNWTEMGNSRITLKDVIGIPYQLMKIKSHYGNPH